MFDSSPTPADEPEMSHRWIAYVSKLLDRRVSVRLSDVAAFALVAIAVIVLGFVWRSWQSASTIHAGSSINRGFLPISRPATYTYSLTWPDCANPYVTPPNPNQLPWIALTTFRLHGDTGIGPTVDIALPAYASDGLHPNGSTAPVTGQVYLGSGNWSGGLVFVAFPGSGVVAEPCAWTLTLAPSP